MYIMPPINATDSIIHNHKKAMANALSSPINGRRMITRDISLTPIPFIDGSILAMEATGTASKTSFSDMCEFNPNAKI